MMRHRQAVRQRTLTPPSQVRPLLAQFMRIWWNGRHARLRIWCFGVWVRCPLSAPRSRIQGEKLIMNYLDGKNFSEEKKYIDAIFTLSGLSECGKSSAGIRMASSPFEIKRYKIIEIEKEMMSARGMDISSGLKDEHFIKLYQDKSEDVFKEFILRLIVHLKEDNIKCVSIESLYRAPFGSFLKREFGNKCANIYIEAPIEIRARREYNKKCYEAFEKGISGISYKEVLESVKMKDAFKESHKASNCKEIADYVIINDEKKDLEDFLHDVDVIVSDTIKGTQVSTCQVMRSSTK